MHGKTLDKLGRDSIFHLVKFSLTSLIAVTNIFAVNLIDWKEANNHIGAVVTVRSVIVSSYKNDKVCYLNFHKDYKRYLSLVIFSRSYSSFPKLPQYLYLNQEVMVTGEVTEYKGRPQIILNDPDQIEIVASGSKSNTKPEPKSSAEAEMTLSLKDSDPILFINAGRHIGETRNKEFAKLYELSGGALFRKLHSLTKEGQIGHGYRSARVYLYNTVDSEKKKVYTLYSGLYFRGSGTNFKESGDQNGDGYANDVVNCESIWPQSKFNKALPMRSDLHHLYPTLSIPNSRRGSFPFGVVENAEYSTRLGSKYGGQEYEPADEAKGNVARAMLYFYTRYYNRKIDRKTNMGSFFFSRLPLLIKWHRQDPPDARERRRNQKIFEFQKTRNPYIDHPEYVNRIGVEGFKSARF